MKIYPNPLKVFHKYENYKLVKNISLSLSNSQLQVLVCASACMYVCLSASEFKKHEFFTNINVDLLKVFSTSIRHDLFYNKVVKNRVVFWFEWVFGHDESLFCIQQLTLFVLYWFMVYTWFELVWMFEWLAFYGYSMMGQICFGMSGGAKTKVILYESV